MCINGPAGCHVFHRQVTNRLRCLRWWNLRNSSLLAHKLRAAESKAGELPRVQGQLVLYQEPDSREKRKKRKQGGKRKMGTLNWVSWEVGRGCQQSCRLSPPARKNLIRPELGLRRNRTVAAVHCVSCWSGPSVPDTGLLPASPQACSQHPELPCPPHPHPLLAVCLRSH